MFSSGLINTPAVPLFVFLKYSIFYIIGIANKQFDTFFADPNVESFLEKELQMVNKYRLMHATAPLRLSLELTNKAELWATELANQDEEKIDVNSKYGQNIFSTKETKDVISKSVQSWYNQIRHFDFHSAKGSVKSDDFSQLVWVGSEEIGVGKAKSASGKTYIVALFNPRGNVDGNFLRNVLPVTGTKISCLTIIDKQSY